MNTCCAGDYVGVGDQPNSKRCATISRMQLADFDYVLPPELIAQTPVEPRDSARLLTYDRATGATGHHTFRDLVDLLQPGDVLVVNDTKVIPARLTTTEGREVFLVRSIDRECKMKNEKCKNTWQCLVRGAKHFMVGSEFQIGADLSGKVVEILPDGERVIAFQSSDFDAALEQHGATPLPPYIASPSPSTGKGRGEGGGVNERYQTVYADDQKKGSVAAPTAGLHFTPELFERLRARGVSVENVMLHVGLGTFQPVKVTDITEHKMHAEFFVLTPEVAERINKAKSAGRRIIAVGTTSCRVLESCADQCGRLLPRTGETKIFIYPGYTFKMIDGLITNFHLPKSTLLMLISALLGREQALALYQLAIKERYRFFSFGDAMLLT